MSRTLLLCACLAAAGAVGCATSPSQPPTAQRTTARSAANDPLCVQASRIASDTCSTPGTKWSRQDLERTGQNNPADALAVLDPSVQVHHP